MICSATSLSCVGLIVGDDLEERKGRQGQKSGRGRAQNFFHPSSPDTLGCSSRYDPCGELFCGPNSASVRCDWPVRFEPGPFCGTLASASLQGSPPNYPDNLIHGISLQELTDADYCFIFQ